MWKSTLMATAFFASSPHDWYRNNPIAHYEGYYASMFYSHFAAPGLEIQPSCHTHLIYRSWQGPRHRHTR